MKFAIVVVIFALAAGTQSHVLPILATHGGILTHDNLLGHGILTHGGVLSHGGVLAHGGLLTHGGVLTHGGLLTHDVLGHSAIVDHSALGLPAAVDVTHGGALLGHGGVLVGNGGALLGHGGVLVRNGGASGHSGIALAVDSNAAHTIHAPSVAVHGLGHHEGQYVAKTRGAVHTAPLAGHIQSVSSVNVAPAPGTL